MKAMGYLSILLAVIVLIGVVLFHILVVGWPQGRNPEHWEILPLYVIPLNLIICGKILINLEEDQKDGSFFRDIFAFASVANFIAASILVYNHLLPITPLVEAILNGPSIPVRLESFFHFFGALFFTFLLAFFAFSVAWKKTH